MSDSLVSVIVPIYNSEKTLTECINSILEQTYTELELILIDDGSRDLSGRICDEYAEKDSRIRVFHRENGGVSRARNFGIDKVRGEYFVCVDSDDTLEQCFIEDLVRTQREYGKIGQVLCGYRNTSEGRSFVFDNEAELSFVDRKDYMKLADKTLSQTLWLRLYRTDTARKHGIRMREDLSLGEDLLFNLEYFDAMDNTEMCVINKASYIYRDDSQGSLNRRYRKDLLEIQELLQSRIKSYLEKWDVTDESSWESYYNSVFYAYLGVLENTFSENNPMSRHEKIKYNSTVMKRTGFTEALNRCTVNISSGLKKTYGSGDYRAVLAYRLAARIKGLFTANT